jgi:hypothetical protein
MVPPLSGHLRPNRSGGNSRVDARSTTGRAIFDVSMRRRRHVASTADNVTFVVELPEPVVSNDAKRQRPLRIGVSNHGSCCVCCNGNEDTWLMEKTSSPRATLCDETVATIPDD